MAAGAGAAGKRGGAGQIKGLRLLTMDRGPDGFGFHMYTNKERDGQFVKSVAPNSSADLAGMLVFDHVVGVDDTVVVGETHHQIVEKVRSGSGKQKKILVIDMETEDEMKARGEEITMEAAIVMIPRKPMPQEEIKTLSPPPPPPAQVEETDSAGIDPGLDFTNIDAARRKGRQAKKDVKVTRSWKESIDAYNNL